MDLPWGGVHLWRKTKRPLESISGVKLRKGSYPLRKSQDIKAKLILEYKDDPVRYEQLLNMFVMALKIADMDEKNSRAYQEKTLENL